MSEPGRLPVGGKQHKGPPKAWGFTLVEVLVSVLVLSLGILGLIGLESLALKNNNSAYQRSQATLLAYDLTDRIRANVDGLDGYDDSVSGTKTACPCTPAQLARNDLLDWQNKLKEVLPDAQPSVAVSLGEVIIDIGWRDHRERETGSQFATFTTRFRP